MEVLGVYRFGSGDSVDADIAYIVDELPDLQMCKKLSQRKLHPLESVITDGRKPNRNFAVIDFDNRCIRDVYVGLPDELNNAIIRTYHLHKQITPLVLKMVERDAFLKAIRAIRVVLTFNTRTKYRSVVKKALKSGLFERVEALKLLDFTPPFNKKKVEDIEIAKRVAFQLGQSIALFYGKELYTKAEIADEFPDLKPCLYREKVDSEALRRRAMELAEIVEGFDFSEEGGIVKCNGREYDLKRERPKQTQTT